jgi:hypothetical protein
MKNCIKCGSHAFNLYAEGIDQGGFCDVHYWQTKAQRPWVGLTDEERSQLVTLHHGWNEYGQAIEAALRSKNT